MECKELASIIAVRQTNEESSLVCHVSFFAEDKEYTPVHSAISITAQERVFPTMY